MRKVSLQITLSPQGKPLKSRWTLRGEDRMIICTSRDFFDYRAFRKELHALGEWMKKTGVDLSEVVDHLTRSDCKAKGK